MGKLNPPFWGGGGGAANGLEPPPPPSPAMGSLGVHVRGVLKKLTDWQPLLKYFGVRSYDWGVF